MTLDVGGAAQLGAKIVRIEFEIGMPTSEMEAVIAGYAAKGIRVAPLAGFDGTLPSAAQAADLASWAKTFGPGGTFWANRTRRPARDPDDRVRQRDLAAATSTATTPVNPPTRRAPRPTRVRVKEAAEAIAASGDECRRAGLRRRLDGRLDERHVRRGPQPRQLHRRLGHPPLRDRLALEARNGHQTGRRPRRAVDAPDRHHRVGHIHRQRALPRAKTTV